MEANNNQVLPIKFNSRENPIKLSDYKNSILIHTYFLSYLAHETVFEHIYFPSWVFRNNVKETIVFPIIDLKQITANVCDLFQWWNIAVSRDLDESLCTFHPDHNFDAKNVFRDTFVHLVLSEVVIVRLERVFLYY